jgi:hypothetical protein
VSEYAQSNLRRIASSVVRQVARLLGRNNTTSHFGELVNPGLPLDKTTTATSPSSERKKEGSHYFDRASPSSS